MSEDIKFSRRKLLATGLGLTFGGRLAHAAVTGQISGLGAGDRSLARLSRLQLSDPLEALQSSYDVVVVGSGYGASVLAARLAPAHGEKLCILERGREWHPGEFPSSPMGLLKSLRSSLDPLGLIDISGPLGSDVDIVCASGLGGTSLINAAIAIRPEPSVFQMPEWPDEIKEEASNGQLERYYAVAESVLKPKQLVRNKMAFKTQVHQSVARSQGARGGHLSLNIRDENFPTGKNEFGYPQGPCVQCGDCCTGCNFGAKNTLVTNYLKLAKDKGAKIFTQIEVHAIEKLPNGQYQLEVTIHQPTQRILRTITARKVILGAGSKGSTEILLRSQSSEMEFSQALGTRLSANGDVMGMAYNTEYRTNILASGTNPLALNLERRPGTIIASYADYRHAGAAERVEDQFLLLDGVVPTGLRDLVGRAIGTYASALYGSRFSEIQLKRLQRDLDPLSPVGEEGALNHSMLYFACGHDSSGGRFVYNKGSDIRYIWKGVGKERTFQRINQMMKSYSEKMGGFFIANPRSEVFGERIQATHPLGGCPMGRDATQGVVNHLGQVFDPKTGSVHQGLYVVDAAIIPRSLAATPLLTITALAERIAHKMMG